MTKMWKLIGGAVLALVLTYAGFSVYNHYKVKHATNSQSVADVAEGQAQGHAANAQALPDHTAAIKAAETKAAEADARAKTAEAKVAQARRERDAALAKLDNQPATVPDARDDVIAKDKVVIEEQAGQIRELQNEVATQKNQVAVLTLALTDEQKKSTEWKAAYEAAERSRMAQAEATKAWKSATTSAEWKGGIKGFGLGVLTTLLTKR